MPFLKMLLLAPFLGGSIALAEAALNPRSDLTSFLREGGKCEVFDCSVGSSSTSGPAVPSMEPGPSGHTAPSWWHTFTTDSHIVTSHVHFIPSRVHDISTENHLSDSGIHWSPSNTHWYGSQSHSTPSNWHNPDSTEWMTTQEPLW